MGFSKGKNSICLEDITDIVEEKTLLYYYLGITEIPTIISSPLRKDIRPSFGLYSLDGKQIFYKDLSTKDRGNLFNLLSKLWNCSFIEVLERIQIDLPKFTSKATIKKMKDAQCRVTSVKSYNKHTDLQCKIREWRSYDLAYWESFGVSLEWLKYAEVYPISHKIVLKKGNKYIFRADKYAYTYVEKKENNITLKIYQPFNKDGYKWSNKHDSSVISLWTKVPEYGDKICICSSLKDALCLWSNAKIPSLAIQGEGYRISDTAIKELKRRYKQIFILFDNDEVGILDGIKLSEDTGFINIVLPNIEGAKDISDLFFNLKDKKKFNTIILNLFK